MENYKTGVILGGIFLEREEFIQIFTEYLNNVGNTFFLEIEKLCQKISKKSYTKAEIVAEWNQILTSISGEAKDVELLGFIRGLDPTNTQQYHITKLLPTKEYLKKSTISLNSAQLLQDLNNINNQIKAQELEKELNKHYEKMLNSLNTQLKDASMAYNVRLMYLRQQPNYKKTKLYKEKWRTHWTGKTYNEIFYTAKNAEGQRVEAFTTHLAEKHIIFFYLLSNIDKYTSLIEEKDNCFQVPINSIFFQNILDSLNNIAWYKGGDLIVVDGSKVIYNIQIKSTMKEAQSYHIALTQLASFLRKIMTLKKEQNNSNQKIAEQMYDHLKVKVLQSSEVEQIEKQFENNILNQVIKELKTSGITIN